jgi:hypothetical protein
LPQAKEAVEEIYPVEENAQGEGEQHPEDNPLQGRHAHLLFLKCG